jgi:hypothetical protein
MARTVAARTLLAIVPCVIGPGCGRPGYGYDEAVLSIPLVAVIKGPDNPFFATLRDGLVATARAITYR